MPNKGRLGTFKVPVVKNESGANKKVSYNGSPIEIEEERVPISDEVRGACEIVGL